jgi:hypothetical protein
MSLFLWGVVHSALGRSGVEWNRENAPKFGGDEPIKVCMQGVQVSSSDRVQLRCSLEQINPDVSPNKLTRALSDILTFMDQLAAANPSGPERKEWDRIRRRIKALPEIHERAQQSALCAGADAATMAELEQRIVEFSQAKTEVSSILGNTWHHIRAEAPVLLTVAAAIALTGWVSQLYWLVGIGLVPLFFTVLMATLAFRSRLLVARLHNAVCDLTQDLSRVEAIAEERRQYEILLARNFDELKAAVRVLVEEAESTAEQRRI